MAIPLNIRQYLLHKNVSYSHKSHSVAYTSQEIAEVERVPGAEFAKTVVVLQPCGELARIETSEMGCAVFLLADHHRFGHFGEFLDE